MSDDRPILLDIDELKTHYHTPQGVVKAVEGASLTVREGQAVGIVGESGCGKSVMLRSILRIVPKPGQIAEGKILEADLQAALDILVAYLGEK